MLRKGENTFGSRRLKGFLYIAAQFLGGIGAALICKFLLGHHNVAVMPYEIFPTPTVPAVNLPDNTAAELAVRSLAEVEEPGHKSNNFASILSEVTGSFIYIFLFMLCTNKETQYSEDKVVNCFIIASSFIAARLMGGGNLVTKLV